MGLWSNTGLGLDYSTFIRLVASWMDLLGVRGAVILCIVLQPFAFLLVCLGKQKEAVEMVCLNYAGIRFFDLRVKGDGWLQLAKHGEPTDNSYMKIMVSSTNKVLTRSFQRFAPMTQREHSQQCESGDQVAGKALNPFLIHGT